MFGRMGQAGFGTPRPRQAGRADSTCCAQTAALELVKHSVVAKHSCYGMLNRIWFDVLASTVEMYGRFPCGKPPKAMLVR